MYTDFLDSLRFDDRGLVAVVAQDYRTGEVLMLAWANREAVEQTLLTGKVHYWSRSRDELWLKGATSGAFQMLRSMRVDCDRDALLVEIEQLGGGACHTGARSCFYTSATGKSAAREFDILEQLDAVIELRRSAEPSESYVSKLLHKKEDSRLKKIGEEAVELVCALKDGSPAAVEETADLLFHVAVALHGRDQDLASVKAVLAERFGYSGIAEKAARSEGT